MIFGMKEKSIILAIATNIPVLLMTGFVVQGHIYELETICNKMLLLSLLIN